MKKKVLRAKRKAVAVKPEVKEVVKPRGRKKKEDK